MKLLFRYLKLFLAKSCFKKDNLKIRKTLKVGTLHEYRETESKQIADSSEGKITFKLKFDDPVEIERKWFNTLTENAVRFTFSGDEESTRFRFPGFFNAHIESLNFEPVRNNINKVKIKDSSITINREALNSFIFCISQVKEKSDAVGIFPDYDDCWHMMDSRKDEFSLKLARLVYSKVIEEYRKGNFIIPEETNINDLKIRVEHGNVWYVPREIHVNSESSLTLDDFMTCMYSMAFIKPPIPFSKEMEYRFLFEFTSEGKIIVPEVKSLIIDAEPLLEFLI